MTSASIESALQLFSLLFDIVVVFRLIHLKFFRIYPFFFALLCVPLWLQTVAVVYGTKSRQFLHSFQWGEPLRNVLYVLVVWELFSVIFRNYAGLRSLSRWVMGIAAVIATVGFSLTIAPIGVSVFNLSPRARRIIGFERGNAVAIVVFIIIMLYFISRYPIKLPRNNVVLCMLYSIWFLGDAAVLLIFSFLQARGHVHIENDILAVLEIGFYLASAMLLSAAGEFQETRVRQHLSAEREESLVGELNAINEVLLRAGRSISHTR